MRLLNPGWQTIEVAGKVADVFEPRHPRIPTQAVLFLHGHGLQTLISNPVYTTELERHGLRAICPHGKRSWWLPVVCPEFDFELSPIGFIRNVILPFMADQWNVKTPAIGVLGVSMGGQGALQLSYRHPNEFPVVAALSPAVDVQDWYGQGLPLDEMFPDREAVRQQSAVVQIQGLNWPRHQFIACDPIDRECVPSVERLLSKLRSSGIPFESDLETSHGGHSWEYFNHMASTAMQYLVKAMDAEHRRLV